MRQRFLRRDFLKQGRDRYGPAGRALDDDALTDIEERFHSLMEQVNAVKADRRRQGAPDMPLGQALESVVAGLHLSQEGWNRLAYAVNTEIEHDVAADVANLSLYSWDQDKQYKGDDVLFPGGYDQIPQALASGLTTALNHRVRQAAHDHPGVTVTTDQAEFRAKRVIITVPLGVLKQRSTLNRVYLRFPERFWPKEPHLFGYISERKGEWAEWLNLAQLTDRPVLLGFSAAAYGRRLESLSDEKTNARQEHFSGGRSRYSVTPIPAEPTR